MITSKIGDTDTEEIGNAFMVSIIAMLILSLIGAVIGGVQALGSSRMPTLADTSIISNTFLGFTIGMFLSVAISLAICKKKSSAFVPFYIYAFILIFFFTLVFQLISPLALLLLTLVVGEILFGLEKNKPKKRQNKMEFTLLRKLENLFEGFLFSGTGLSWYFMVQYASINLVTGLIGILAWVGTGGTLILGIYAYVWVNSLKYKRGKK